MSNDDICCSRERACRVCKCSCAIGDWKAWDSKSRIGRANNHVGSWSQRARRICVLSHWTSWSARDCDRGIRRANNHVSSRSISSGRIGAGRVSSRWKARDRNGGMILGHVRIASRSEGRVATGSDALRGVRKHVGRRSGETGETEVRAEERCRYDTCESH